MTGYNPNNLVGRLTVTDNRLRGRLLSQFGIPTIKLVRWVLDGVVTPKMALRVTAIGAPTNYAYLQSSVNLQLEVSEETLVIRDIPRQVNGVGIDVSILKYGMVELFESSAPLVVSDRCEVVDLDETKLTTYTAKVKPFRNR